MRPGERQCLHLGLREHRLDPTQPLQTLAPGAATSIVVPFRVYIPSVSIVVDGKSSTTAGWLNELYAVPGETLSMAIIVGDDGNTPLYGVTANFVLPPGLTYVPSSTTTGPSTTARGKPVPDGVVVPIYSDPGINLGTLQPGQQVVVQFSVQVGSHVQSGATLRGFADTMITGMDYFYNLVNINVQ